MNFIQMLRLLACAFAVFMMTESFVVASDRVALARGAVDAALSDKQHDESGLNNDQDDEFNDEEDEDLDNGEEVSAVKQSWTNNIPSVAALRAAGSGCFDRGLACGRRGVDYVRSIDYRGNASWAAQNLRKIYDNGFVHSCWSGIRKAYWHSRVIPSGVQDFNNIYVFGPEGADLQLTTVDGYNFIVPASVIGKGFLSQRVAQNFAAIVLGIKKQFGINPSLKVMYLLFGIKQMQLAEGAAEMSAQALFEANVDGLGNIALRLGDDTLFDAIKVCGHLDIIDPVVLEVLSHVVANVLCKRYPLATALKIVNEKLEFFPLNRSTLMAAIDVIIDKTLAAERSKAVQASPVVVASTAATVPDAKSVLVRKSKRVRKK